MADGEKDHEPDAGREQEASGGAGDLAMRSLTQVSGASIFWLWAIHLATPRAMPIMPRVMMNGTSRSRVIRSAVEEADQPARQDAEDDGRRRAGGRR